MDCKMNSCSSAQIPYCQDLVSGTPQPGPAKRSGAPINAIKPHKIAPLSRMGLIPAPGRVKPSSLTPQRPAMANATTQAEATMLKKEFNLPGGVQMAITMPTKTMAISSKSLRECALAWAEDRPGDCTLPLAGTVDSAAEKTSDFSAIGESI